MLSSFSSCSPPVSWGLLYKVLCQLLCSSSSPLLLVLRLLNRERRMAVFYAGPQPSAPDPLDLHRQLRTAVLPAGPQPPPPGGSVPRRTSTAVFPTGHQPPASPPDLNKPPARTAVFPGDLSRKNVRRYATYAGKTAKKKARKYARKNVSRNVG